MTRRSARGFAALAAALATAATLTACASSTSPGHATVIASTDVWGDITAAVAGPDITVDSIIHDATADPHSYELSPADAAKISDAELVVYNGGHYDEFVDKAIAGKNKKTVNAYDIATGGEDGHDHDATTVAADRHEANEHIWYDVAQVGHIATHIATALGDIDPGHKQAYLDRAAAFTAQLAPIQAVTAQIAATHPGAPVVQTEPLAAYLLAAAKADDKTPFAFQQAAEQGADPAPADLAAVRDLLSGKKVRALVYNIQTADKTTGNLVDLARASGVAVVDVSETLPHDTGYVQWMTSNAQALAKALG